MCVLTPQVLFRNFVQTYTHRSANLYFENKTRKPLLFPATSVFRRHPRALPPMSDVGGLQVVEHVHLPVAASVGVLPLPVGFRLHLGQGEAVVRLLRGRGGRLLQVDGGAARFRDGGVGVVVEVVVGSGRVSPAGFAPGEPPLSPLPPQRSLGLDANNDGQEGIEWNDGRFKSLRQKTLDMLYQ